MGFQTLVPFGPWNWLFFLVALKCGGASSDRSLEAGPDWGDTGPEKMTLWALPPTLHISKVKCG